MTASAKPLLTVGVIAHRLSVPVHRVEYAIRSRNIRPRGRAGNARVFTEADLRRIVVSLHCTDQERDGEHR